VLKLPNLEMQSIRLLDLGDPALDPTTVPQTRRATDPDGRANDVPGRSGLHALRKGRCVTGDLWKS
jgi:hypothetical protein